MWEARSLRRRRCGATAGVRILSAALAAIMAGSAWGEGDAEKAIIAHRGAPGYLPEHTLESYAMAYGQGADYLEPDLVLTQDGVPIALHDLTLEATTNVADVFPDRARDNGGYYAIDFALDEIKELDVRERVDPETGERVYPDRFPEAHGALVFRVATLKELIALVQGLNQSTGRSAGIYPELKASAWHADEGYDFEAILLETLREHGYESRGDPVIIQSFEPESLVRLRELGCEMRIVQLIGGGASADPLTSPEGLDEIATYADGIGPSLTRIIDRDGAPVDDNALIQEAHARNLAAHPWTVRADQLPAYADSAEELLERLLFEFGADGVFIDQPDVAAAFLRERAAANE